MCYCLKRGKLNRFIPGLNCEPVWLWVHSYWWSSGESLRLSSLEVRAYSSHPTEMAAVARQPKHRHLTAASGTWGSQQGLLMCGTSRGSRLICLNRRNNLDKGVDKSSMEVLLSPAGWVQCAAFDVTVTPLGLDSYWSRDCGNIPSPL